MEIDKVELEREVEEYAREASLRKKPSSCEFS